MPQIMVRRDKYVGDLHTGPHGFLHQANAFYKYKISFPAISDGPGQFELGIVTTGNDVVLIRGHSFLEGSLSLNCCTQCLQSLNLTLDETRNPADEQARTAKR
jgi:hypothetical protein